MTAFGSLRICSLHIEIKSLVVGESMSDIVVPENPDDLSPDEWQINRGELVLPKQTDEEVLFSLISKHAGDGPGFEEALKAEENGEVLHHMLMTYLSVVCHVAEDVLPDGALTDDEFLGLVDNIVCGGHVFIQQVLDRQDIISDMKDPRLWDINRRPRVVKGPWRK